MEGIFKRVFLSHSSHDKQAVWRLAEDLRANGVDVWLDEWEIRVGDQISQKIQEGLAQSDFLAVWLSRNAVQSGWVEREWQSKYHDEVEERKTVVLPLLADSCEIPPLLKDKKYADFRYEYAIGLEQLLRVFDPSKHPFTALSQAAGRLVTASDKEAIRTFLLFLEDRRILYSPETGHSIAHHYVHAGLAKSLSLSAHACASILKIREKSGETLERLSPDSAATPHLKKIQAHCRWALDASDKLESDSWSDPDYPNLLQVTYMGETHGGTHPRSFALTFLGLFRRKMGKEIKSLADMAGVTIYGDLADTVALTNPIAEFFEDQGALADAALKAYGRRHWGFKGLTPGWFERLCSSIQHRQSATPPIIELLQLLASEQRQLSLDRDDEDGITANFHSWYESEYHPDDPNFVSCFSADELAALAEFHRFYDEQRHQLQPSEGTVRNWLESPVWRDIMKKAELTLKRIAS